MRQSEKSVVLIVDDEPEILRALRAGLAAQGYEILAASTGEEALNLAASRSPNLVILDVMMSWIDGFELCRSIKKSEQFKDIPVLFLSARKSGDDQRRGLDAGACEYFTKPVQVDKLIARVQELIGVADPEAAAAHA